jgi:hypothetical protein
MIKSKTQEYLRCPFCEKLCIEPESGNTECPECGSEFEIDDRSECVFANTKNLRLPAKGTVCSFCGLIQNVDVEACLYCGTWINSNVQ